MWVGIGKYLGFYFLCYCIIGSVLFGVYVGWWWVYLFGLFFYDELVKVDIGEYFFDGFKEVLLGVFCFFIYKRSNCIWIVISIFIEFFF